MTRHYSDFMHLRNGSVTSESKICGSSLKVARHVGRGVAGEEIHLYVVPATNLRLL